MINKKSSSGNFTIWVIVLGLIVVFGTLVLLAVFKNNKKTENNFGVLLDRGFVYEWKYENGLLNVQIENENEKINKYGIYVGKLTNILKAQAMAEGNSFSYDQKSLQSGQFSEIGVNKYVEIYLQYPYEDTRRGATTIIYWE